MLIDLFDKDQENRAPDLLALLKLCQKEYLASKEERDQACIENFFISPWREKLELGRRLFARSENPNISHFARRLGVLLHMRERHASKSGDEGRISYAFLFTGTPPGQAISFETLMTQFEELNDSLLAALNSTNLEQSLEEHDAGIIVAFFTFAGQKVREKLMEMHKGEEQKQEDLDAPEVSSSSSLVNELD